MNKSMKFALILAMAVAIAMGGVLTGFSGDFEPVFDGSQKMNLILKGVWRDSMREGDLEKWVSCAIKLEGKADAEVLNALREAGFRPNTVLRSIVTGKIRIGDIPLLVSLDEVISVSTSKPVSLKPAMVK